MCNGVGHFHLLGLSVSVVQNGSFTVWVDPITLKSQIQGGIHRKISTNKAILGVGLTNHGGWDYFAWFGLVGV